MPHDSGGLAYIIFTPAPCTYPVFLPTPPAATLAAVVNRGMAGSPYPSDAPQRRGVSAVTLAMRVGQRVQEELQVQALRDVLAQGRARGLSSRGRGGRGKAQAGQPSVAVERLRKMERLLREAEELGMRPSGRGTPRQRLHGSIAYTLRTLGNTLPWLERQGGATAAAAGGAGRSALAVLGDWDPEMLVQVRAARAGEHMVWVAQASSRPGPWPMGLASQLVVGWYVG